MLHINKRTTLGVEMSMMGVNAFRHLTTIIDLLNQWHLQLEVGDSCHLLRTLLPLLPWVEWIMAVVLVRLCTVSILVGRMVS
jgi:hypothetical protein